MVLVGIILIESMHRNNFFIPLLTDSKVTPKSKEVRQKITTARKGSMARQIFYSGKIHKTWCWEHDKFS